MMYIVAQNQRFELHASSILAPGEKSFSPTTGANHL